MMTLMLLGMIFSILGGIFMFMGEILWFFTTKFFKAIFYLGGFLFVLAFLGLLL